MQIKNIIVHHTGGTDAYPLQDSSNYTLKQCDADHKRRFPDLKSSLGWYVGYHYFIDKAGVVTQTRVDTEEGAHCIGYNNHPGDNPSTFSIGVCLAGNFDATLPTDAQVKALQALLATKMNQYGIVPANVFPHRKHAHKTCYGRKLEDGWAASLAAGAIAPVAPVLKVASMGELGDNVLAIQKALTKHGYAAVSFKPGIYDEDMAKNVLFFQIENKVAGSSELGQLRGEKVGPKTIAVLNGLK